MNPLPAKIPAASAGLSPITEGNGTEDGPIETCITTGRSRSCSVPKFGIVATTLPSAIKSSFTSSTELTQPYSFSSSAAKDNNCPVRFGT